MAKYNMQDIYNSNPDDFEPLHVKLYINWISYRLQWLIANFPKRTPNK